MLKSVGQERSTDQDEEKPHGRKEGEHNRETKEQDEGEEGAEKRGGDLVEPIYRRGDGGKHVRERERERERERQ